MDRSGHLSKNIYRKYIFSKNVVYILLFMCLSLAMSSDDDFDTAAYKEFEDQLYEEQSLSGLVVIFLIFYWKLNVHSLSPIKT